MLGAKLLAEGERERERNENEIGRGGGGERERGESVCGVGGGGRERRECVWGGGIGYSFTAPTALPGILARASWWGIGTTCFHNWFPAIGDNRDTFGGCWCRF